MMAEAKIDALLIADPFNYFYFSGHKVPLNKMRPWFMILPLDKDPILIDYSLDEQFSRVYNEQYSSWISDRRFYIDVPFTSELVKDWGLGRALEDLGLANGVIGAELGEHTRLNIPYNDFNKLKQQLPHAKFTDASTLIWKCRMVKSQWEASNLREAVEIGCKSWKELFETLKIDVSVKEINTRLLKLYVENGADIDNPGSQSVKGARGPNSTFQKGDIMYLDGGCYYKGYKMDISREVVFGEPTGRQLQDHGFVWECCKKIISNMRPGLKVSDTHRIFNEQLKAAGRPLMDPVKRIGHGIGLEASEPPSLNAIDQTVLEEGMSVTPEPRIETLDGLIVAEEHVLITSSGCEVLSKHLSSELFKAQ